ncbi:HpcH/HpaI aldolase/citrate lyase family protein [Sphingobium algorifonticola]|uniref:CoA ester lyase n=1 Tax=Sphingobium algorifonticola TaxID=2008318 RepID=A0A437J9S7_9SPHN|nr:CoA ester lyase [Sphingobium algorifonticola]RVT42224.1 CoA ester lyase [Sphingobium algorifonticola]
MQLAYARSLLFLPASNPRAVEKARGLDCDMVILDLEDAVPDAQKDDARTAAAAAHYPGKLTGIRINMEGTPWHGVDMVAAKQSAADYVILPKVESAQQVHDVTSVTEKPVIAMIESARGLIAASAIAAQAGTAALFVGVNDLRKDMGIAADAGRIGLMLALQTVVLAARASGKAVFDGVYNRLDDGEGLAAECREGRAFGFDGKTLIHPNQIAVTNSLFGPDAQALADARRLIAAATGGAERFEGSMIEAMHVDAARALIERADALGI